jgi:protein gp37
MADVFEKDAPAEDQKRLWALIEATPHLRWLLLTKRPERITGLVPALWLEKPRANVWYGTSVESEEFTNRIDDLRRVPAAVRFLSVEPLLGPIPDLPLVGIHWVIVGGESGGGARPMEAVWARQIRDRCIKHCVPFFFKQWGQHDAKGVRRASKHDAGRSLDGRKWNELPEEAAV